MSKIDSYELNMFAHTITVNVWDEPLKEEQVSSTEVEQVWGNCNPKKGEINVYCNLDDPSKFFTTVLHELIEAANAYADLNLNHTQITTLAALLNQTVWNMLAHSDTLILKAVECKKQHEANKRFQD